MDKIYANIAKNVNEKWQLLNDHIVNVGKKFSEFAKLFGLSDMAYNIDFLHDLRKISDDFQKYLKDSSNKNFR